MDNDYIAVSMNNYKPPSTEELLALKRPSTIREWCERIDHLRISDYWTVTYGWNLEAIDALIRKLMSRHMFHREFEFMYFLLNERQRIIDQMPENIKLIRAMREDFNAEYERRYLVTPFTNYIKLRKQ